MGNAFVQFQILTFISQNFHDGGAGGPGDTQDRININFLHIAGEDPLDRHIGNAAFFGKSGNGQIPFAAVISDEIRYILINLTVHQHKRTPLIFVKKYQK